MPSLPLTLKRKQTEWTLIQLITQNYNVQQKAHTKSKPANTTQKNQPGSNQWKKQKQKMDNLHILQPKNKKNHKSIQAH